MKRGLIGKRKRMCRYFLKGGLSLILLAGLSPLLVASGRFKGYVIGEYYLVGQHHDEDFQGRHGFWFRRIYFTYDRSLAKEVKMRLRLEMNSPGDFTSSLPLTPVVKDAYLSFKGFRQLITVGLQPTPTFDQIEKIWGYRALEKTPVDLYRLRSARDFGLAIKGSLSQRCQVEYTLMYANGSALRGEINRGKMFYARLNTQPWPGFYVELYGDYETQADQRRAWFGQGFAAFQGKWGRIGLQIAHKHFSLNGQAFNYQIFSLFLVFPLKNRVGLVSRLDVTAGNGFKEWFRGERVPYIPLATNSPPRLVLGALSWQVAKDIWIIPNIKYVFYHSPHLLENPGNDFYLNLTWWYKF